MNGGPGCTSLKGGFEELGQLVFNYKSLDDPKNMVPTLSYNPYGWTQVLVPPSCHTPHGSIATPSPCGVGSHTRHMGVMSAHGVNIDGCARYPRCPTC